MTQIARLALADCGAALADLRDEPTGLLWRTRWAACVALLRSVGHILTKIDSEVSTEAAAVIGVAWKELNKTKPEPKIFWGFIEEERNSILKEYRTAARQHVTVRPGTIHLNAKTGEQWSSPGGPTTYSHVMSDGPFAGEDPREVVARAINWWTQYLDKVDQRIASKKGGALA